MLSPVSVAKFSFPVKMSRCIFYRVIARFIRFATKETGRGDCCNRLWTCSLNFRDTPCRRTNERSHINQRWIALAISVLLLSPPTLFAERWGILPVRIESPQTANAELGIALARAGALYLKLLKISTAIPVAEIEGCVKSAGINFQNKIALESISQIAQDCDADRLIAFRIQKKSDGYQLISKIYYRESRTITDTIATSGELLLPALGDHLSRRFQKKIQFGEKHLNDLIFSTDTFGSSYFEWQFLRPLISRVDFDRLGFCLLQANGKVSRQSLTSEREISNEFLKRIRFEGIGSYDSYANLEKCTANLVAESRERNNTPHVVIFASDVPQNSDAVHSLKARLRTMSQKTHLHIWLSSNASSRTAKFWIDLSRELSQLNAVEIEPIALRQKVGLSSGGEWHIFRKNGRLYETQEAAPSKLSGGISIPDKLNEEHSAGDFSRLYSVMSKNKVISKSEPTVFTEPLLESIRFSGSPQSEHAEASWKVFLEDEGVSYVLKLPAREARRLEIGKMVYILTSIRRGSDQDILQNESALSFVLKNASEVSSLLQIKIADFIRNPQPFENKSLAGRSIYILSGKVKSVQPSDADVLE